MAKSSQVAEEPHNADKGSRRPNPVDIRLAGRLRFRRMLLGMSREKLGEKLGLTYQQIQKYEKGINRIGASRLFDIAQVLGVTVQFFYEEAPSTAPRQFDEDDHADIAPETSTIEFPRSREGLELNRAFERISHAKARRAIVKLVRNLADQDASDKRQPPSLTRAPVRPMAAPERGKKKRGR